MFSKRVLNDLFSELQKQETEIKTKNNRVNSKYWHCIIFIGLTYSSFRSELNSVRDDTIKKTEKLWVLSKVWVGGSRLKRVSKPNILAFLGGKLA